MNEVDGCNCVSCDILRANYKKVTFVGEEELEVEGLSTNFPVEYDWIIKPRNLENK